MLTEIIFGFSVQIVPCSVKLLQPDGYLVPLAALNWAAKQQHIQVTPA